MIPTIEKVWVTNGTLSGWVDEDRWDIIEAFQAGAVPILGNPNSIPFALGVADGQERAVTAHKYPDYSGERAWRRAGLWNHFCTWLQWAGIWK